MHRHPLPLALLGLGIAACGPGETKGCATGACGDSGGAPAAGEGAEGATPEDNLRLPDGEDNDCDGEIDEPGEAERRVLTAVDADGDGWSAGPPTMGCLGGGAPITALQGFGDCNDANAAIRPDAPELCLRRGDDDCDGLADCADPACGGRDCAEDCHDGLDDDGDGDTDCVDNSCAFDPACDEVCGDGLDNDADGAVDCVDTDCAREPACAEDCDDGVDNDVDGVTDCADWDCRTEVDCIEDCDDRVDNDVDGATDCTDWDCRGEVECIEDCDDGVDNNRDGALDCRDRQCVFDPACAEDCGDGLDNDDDGAVDCAEASCASPSCPELCADGLDNDVDGDRDCADPDCSSPSCAELCGDGVDNDTDGLTDCADPDCARATCAEDCDDGLDNNANGLADCADWSCRSDPWCLEVCDDGVDNDRNGLADCEDAACARVCAEDCDGTDNDRDGLVRCDDPDCGLLIACWSSLSVTVDAPAVRRTVRAQVDSSGHPYLAGGQVFAADRLLIEGLAHTAAGAPLPCAVEVLSLSVEGYWAEFAPRAATGAVSSRVGSAVAGTTMPPADPACPLVRPMHLDPTIPGRLASLSATWAIFPGEGLDLLALTQAVPGGAERSLLELIVASPSTYTVRPVMSATFPWERFASQDLTGVFQVVPTP